MTRTTRGLTLTEAGADYLARIEPILVALEEADHAARGTGELRGRLRIASSLSFGAREVIPLLPAFMQLHPALRIDLLMNDRHEDLVAEGVDVALRFGTLTDSSATARRLGASPRLLVASPAYLSRAGSPDTPESLANHEVILGPLGVGLESCIFRPARAGRGSLDSDHAEASAEHRAPVALVCSSKRPDARRDRFTGPESVSERATKAWLNDVQDVSRLKSISTIRLTVCARRSSPKSTSCWCLRSSVWSAHG